MFFVYGWKGNFAIRNFAKFRTFREISLHVYEISLEFCIAKFPFNPYASKIFPLITMKQTSNWLLKWIQRL
jgi:hypothetical protein